MDDGHHQQQRDASMEEAEAAADRSPVAKRRRAVKACATCRRSKVRCDGAKPCGRCASVNAECVYMEVPLDPTTEKLQQLEAEVRSLRASVSSLQALPSPIGQHHRHDNVALTESITSPEGSRARRGITQPMVSSEFLSTVGSSDIRQLEFADPDAASSLGARPPFVNVATGTLNHPGWGQETQEASKKRKRGAFEVQARTSMDVVARGIVTGQEAGLWFNSFFKGCNQFVPVFCPQYDTYASVRARNSILFDAIITVGCRTADGPASPSYQRLQPILREHLANFLLAPYFPQHGSVETIQALLVMASYSDNGWLITSIALNLALHLQLPEAVDQCIESTARKRNEPGFAQGNEEDHFLYRMARIWYGVLNLDHILALDGGRKPAVTHIRSSRRLRVLLNHPSTNPIDVRLFAQVELNALRASTLEALPRTSGFSMVGNEEGEMSSTVRGARIDLDLWLDDWLQIWEKYSHREDPNTGTNLLNLKIQHQWALIALHLKAISLMEVDNLALMTETQREILIVAKEAAEKHLDLLLHATSPSDGGDQDPSSPLSTRSYLAGFRWTMDFVWAKCAFSVLLVLRLSVLLRDPPNHLMHLLRQAHELLDELERGTGGQIAYFQVLSVSVEKCEKALVETLRRHQAERAPDGSVGAPDVTTRPSGENYHYAERDFQSYAPRELLLQWDFPGLNLRYVPLGWQDLFMEFDSLF